MDAEQLIKIVVRTLISAVKEFDMEIGISISTPIATVTAEIKAKGKGD